jgi:prepilin-type N-terminal cleavage/methylation domain-containing protein/prepilin-type processing-associated H-X9-DG protein
MVCDNVCCGISLMPQQTILFEMKIMTSKRCIMRRKGFTLVELLVVISIIAILLAVLMPALGKVKKTAMRVICVSNEKQWALGFEMYTNNYNGKFPTAPYPSDSGCWINAVPKYIAADPNVASDIYLCPAAKQPYDKGGKWPFAAWGGTSNLWGITRTYPYFSYGENGWIRSKDFSGAVAWEKNSMWRNKNNITRPWMVPVFGDCTFPVSNDPRYTPRNLPPTTSSVDMNPVNSLNTANNLNRFFISRHDLSVNMLMADWSVKRVGLKQLLKLRWHRTWELIMSTATPRYENITWPDWVKNARDYE